jgi:hypothetical protein
MPRGSKNPRAMLDEVQVEIIKEMINEGISFKEILLTFDMSLNTLKGISAGYSWKHVDPEAKAKRGRTDLTRFKEGYSERL